MQPSVLTTAQVASLTGKSRVTVWKLGMQDPRWSACIIRQTRHSTDWSRSRLIAAGILCEASAPQEQAEGLAFNVVAPSWRVG
jgi:hypothetical protein